METWALRDHSGRLTGETMVRGTAVPADRYHDIIGVWTIHRQTGKLLITLRAKEKKVCPNRWENTGGSVLFGENVAQGAAREVREETGLPCLASDLLPIVKLRTEMEFVHCFIYYTDSDQIILQEGETSDYRWVTLNDIDRLIHQQQFAEPEIHQYAASRAVLAEAMERIHRGDSPLLTRRHIELQDVRVHQK